MSVSNLSEFYASSDEPGFIWNPSKKAVAAKMENRKVVLMPYGQGGSIIDNIWKGGIFVPEEHRLELLGTKMQEFIYPDNPNFSKAFWTIAWPNLQKLSWCLVKVNKLDEFKTSWFDFIVRRKREIEASDKASNTSEFKKKGRTISDELNGMLP